MNIIVQKFGGTSLRDEQVREQAIKHIVRGKEEGYGVVVVVSAMGRKGEPYATDTFLDWITHNGNELSMREKDLLLSCGEMISSTTLSSLLNARGIPAVALTGWQAGIITNEQFGNAQIRSVDPSRIRGELEQGKVVIVCGFQGGTQGGEVTTLGRGGSDTTATALGVALQADYVDIFTDVKGIMTADPRIVEDASHLDTVTYTEISNMAHQGAKVVHPRAVEVAMHGQVPIRVRSTMSDDFGTLVTGKNSEQFEQLKDRLITGIAHVPHLSQIKVTANEADYDFQMNVFKAMSQHHISVDFINVNPLGVVYTVPDDVVDQAIDILKNIGYDPAVQRHCAKVSVIGAGIAGVPGVMSKIVEALTGEDIQILQSADSHTTIWVLVKEEHMEKAVRALHRTFQLHEL
jgi:aspartate kinase